MARLAHANEVLDNPPQMRTLAVTTIVALGAFGSGMVSAQAPARLDLLTLLRSAGEKVEQYFARAQSLVVLETQRLQPLSHTLSAEGFARTVESELRLSWDPFDHSEGAPMARTLRQVLRVNGHAPRKKDPNACTAPEQNDKEPQLLSVLLDAERDEFVFALGKPGKVDGRQAIVVEFVPKGRVEVQSWETEGQENCVTYAVSNGQRGRFWLDPDTHEVLRLDRTLVGLIDIPLPPKMARRSNLSDPWTLERWDISVRFRPVRFQDPDETLILPVSSTTLSVTRNGGQRLRTVTEYSGYKRFLTGGRVVPQG